MASEVEMQGWSEEEVRDWLHTVLSCSWTGALGDAADESRAIELWSTIFENSFIDGTVLAELADDALKMACRRQEKNSPAIKWPELRQVILSARDAQLRGRPRDGGDAAEDENEDEEQVTPRVRLFKNGDVVIGELKYNKSYRNVIGMGRFGVVYRGTFGGRPCAVKRVGQGNQSARVRTIEIDHLMNMNQDSERHQNIVLYMGREEDEANQVLYIAMEECEESLTARMVRTGTGTKMSVAERTRTCRQLVEGVAYMHSDSTELFRLDQRHKSWRDKRPILHRDIKPDNLLFKGDVLKIADFGQSRELLLSVVKTATPGGTSGWTAPELANETATESKPSDIFSVGCVLFYVLSGGCHPFGDDPANRDQRIRNQLDKKRGTGQISWKPLTSRCPTTSAEHLLRHMLQTDPLRRPTIAQVRAHPLFLSSTEKVEFIRKMNNRKTHHWAALESWQTPPKWKDASELGELIEVMSKGQHGGQPYTDSWQQMARLFRNVEAHDLEKHAALAKLFGKPWTPEAADELLVEHFEDRVPGVLRGLICGPNWPNDGGAVSPPASPRSPRGGGADSAGVINLASPWTRYTNRGGALYQRRDPVEQSLEAPAEGVKDVQAIGDAEFEKLYAKTDAGKAAAAKAWAAAPAVVVISGAEGPSAGIANGRFELAERDVYRKVGGAERWLYIASSGWWWVGDTEDKDARETRGWAHSVASANGLPPASGEAQWKVADGKGGWVEQALQLRTLNTILTKVADFVQAHPGLSTVAHLFSAFAKLHPGVKPPKGLKWTAFLTKHAAALAHVFTLEPIDDSGNMTIVRAI